MKAGKLLMALLLAALPLSTYAAREVYDLGRGWKFYTVSERDYEEVNLPHTWNHDALSGRRDYYRGIGNYLKYVDIKPQWKGRRIFVKFYGAGTVTDLLVDGRFAGEHRGGDNAFVIEITDCVTFGQRNLLWVMVNNAPRIDVLPTAGAGNAYGGIYRPVELIVTDPLAVGLGEDGSEGVAVRLSQVSEQKAEGEVEVEVSYKAPADERRGSGDDVPVRCEVRIVGAEGEVATEVAGKGTVRTGAARISVPFEIARPRLWRGKADPYLYRVEVAVISGDRERDRVAVSTGFRTVEVVPSGPLLLNGEPYPVRGVKLYRDRAATGPAVVRGHIEQDLELVLEMGANAVRVAGGSHCREFYELCDRLGLLVITGLPLTGSTHLENKSFYNTEGFRANGFRHLRETAAQLGNHPSVVAWCLFSDLELRGDDPVPYLKLLNAMARELDPGRPTLCSSQSDGDINFITDLVIWNHRLGWTEGMPEDIALWQKQFHGDTRWRSFRSAVGYSCGGSVWQQSFRPKKPHSLGNFHPEGWQTYFHEVYMRSLKPDTLFWGIIAGNMFDFGAARRSYGERVGVNDHGLVTFDRATRKDAFYLYKANWNDEEPFVHIVGRRLGRRGRQAVTVKAYSNLPAAELFVGGVSFGERTAADGILTWDNVPLSEGGNRVEVRAAAPDGPAVSDAVDVIFDPAVPQSL